MARKKAKKKTVAKHGKTKAIAKHGNWKEELRKRAEKVAATEVGGGGAFISTKGGEFTYKGDVLPQPLPVVIVGYAFMNNYFDGPYDDDNPQVPACFAISKAEPGCEDEMAPHPDSPSPQAETCADCEWNAWRSDERGKGKACKNTRRIALVAADDVDDIDESTEIAYMSVPPASLKYFSGHVKKVSKVLQLPPEGVITTMEIERLGGGHAVKFSMDEDNWEIPDELMPTVLSLRDACEDDLLSAPDVSSYGQEVKKPSRAKASKKRAKVKKKKSKRKY